MGGPVKMAMRDEEGNVYAGELYTSSISAFFDNDRFVHRDLLHVRDFFTDYPGVNEDRTVAPGGYGLVLGDHKTKKIYTMQGYTSLNQISETSLSLSLTGGIRTGDTDTERDNYIEHNRFARLYKAGYIKNKVVRNWSQDYGITDVVVPLDTSIPVEHIFKKIIEEKSRESMHSHFPIDYGFEIIHYKETPAGITQFKKDLEEAGFVFNDQDNNVWAEYLADSKEGYEEDDESWDPDPYE